MYRSRLLFVTFVIAVVLHSVLGQAQPKCSSILKTKCTTNADCTCSIPRRLICNYKSECNRISIIDIMLRQRKRSCPNIFKKKCRTNLDCPCKKARYICEDRECVHRGQNPTRKSQY